MKKHILAINETMPETFDSMLLQMKFIEECRPDQNNIESTAFNGTACIEAPCYAVVQDPLKEPRISRLTVGGARDWMKYEMEIVDGIQDFCVNNGWDYTYHQRFVEQLDDVLEILKTAGTRRAVLQIRDWEHDLYTTDPACLQYIYLQIRNNKLESHFHMRSNDLINATIMNMWGFIRLVESICKRLRFVYPELTVGEYVHQVDSLHVYAKDLKQFHSFVERIRKNRENSKTYPTTYTYEEQYRIEMESHIPAITEDMDNLKKNTRRYPR